MKEAKDRRKAVLVEGLVACPSRKHLKLNILFIDLVGLFLAGNQIVHFQGRCFSILRIFLNYLTAS